MRYKFDKMGECGVDEIRWERVDSGRYSIGLEGWSFVVGRVDDPDDSCYKFELYENMERPQSASSMNVRIHGHNLTARIQKANNPGALQHITGYVEETSAFGYEGIPEPLKGNLINALELASVNLKS